MKPIDGVGIVREILERRKMKLGGLARAVGIAPSSLTRTVNKTGGYEGDMTLTTLNKIIEWDNATLSGEFTSAETFGG
jgi:DNA-binding Xre family transcriptional regulator